MGLSTNAYLFIGLVGVFLLVLILRSGLRKPQREQPSAASRAPQAKKPATPQNPFRATSIVAGPNACEAAKRLGEKRFLVAAKEVPQLPLPDCDQSKCTCKYAHHADRREKVSDDRRGPPGLRSQLHGHSGEEDRRSKKRGRRASDWE